MATATGGSSRSYQHGREDQYQEGRQSPATRQTRSADTGFAATTSSEPLSSAALKTSEPALPHETTSSNRTELEEARPLASLDASRSHAHLSAQVEQLAAERDSLVEHVRDLESQLAETADPREVEGLRVRIEEQEVEVDELRDQAEESRERILSLVSLSDLISSSSFPLFWCRKQRS